ncbi:RIP metalloprotease RseP [Roseomonas marmotae]|uniref:Zinc metalloprotease n=1 Tax=Roseomonas marmotae TaxID=2768161 RepID=A0ABS3K9Y8_9PROT|nr:RIP metalloprotease RseP [Roseomonas marmotae]MBO1074281.1 RIP metalloprotease RseP [Roseomonas marmotae]QTI78035.1 RIP metalloprotease RseP [Roseomonas marmotae]
MDFLSDGLRTVISFIVVLGVLVFVHEMGHYLAARWRGVHVEVFSIGFGKVIRSWTDRVGTEWRLSWLPLGGFVKLHGQEGLDATPEQKARWLHGRTFHDKPVRDRAIVVAAGPIANFLLAALLFAGLYMTMGQPLPSATVGAVVEGSAAAQAGLQPGDRILALDGQEVARFEDVQRHIQARPGQPVELRINRAGDEQRLTATPTARESDGRAVGILGVTGGAPEFRRLDPFSALAAGVVQTWDIGAQTIAGIWEMITGSRGTEDLGGPLRIAQLSGQVAQLGIPSLITFIAVLSVNLGLINLFPIPVLDGGHLLFYAAEAVRGRPLPARAMEYGFRAGIAVLVALFVFTTWNDITRLAIFGWVARLFG